MVPAGANCHTWCLEEFWNNILTERLVITSLHMVPGALLTLGSVPGLFFHRPEQNNREHFIYSSVTTNKVGKVSRGASTWDKGACCTAELHSQFLYAFPSNNYTSWHNLLVPLLSFPGHAGCFRSQLYVQTGAAG